MQYTKEKFIKELNTLGYVETDRQYYTNDNKYCWAIMVFDLGFILSMKLHSNLEYSNHNLLLLIKMSKGEHINLDDFIRADTFKQVMDDYIVNGKEKWSDTLARSNKLQYEDWLKKYNERNI